MCTAIIEVPLEPSKVTRVLAVRDEDPNRPWDPPGEWWHDALPGVIGVRDRLANGAWLAAAPARGRLAVLLNRAVDDGTTPHFSHATPATTGLMSRGSLVLASTQGRQVADHPGTAGFNLVEVRGTTSTITSWDGRRLTHTPLEPGVHMIAHQDVDDVRTERIDRWLPEFQALAGLPDGQWREAWLALLERTRELSPEDDRAIVRDNRVHGYPTQSLLVCTAEVGARKVGLEYKLYPEVLS